MPENLDLLHLLASFGASAAGALTAGYFGVLWALRQRRAERAFDRRIEWMETMHATLHAAAHAQDRLFNITGFADAQPSEIDKADIEAELTYREVRRVAEARSLYASPAATAKLDRALEEINRILTDGALIKQTGIPDEWDAKRNRCFQLGLWLREAAGTLIEEVHADLGYLPWWKRATNRRRKKKHPRLLTHAESQQLKVDKEREHGKRDR